mgnify:CR=1 FL=1
MKKGGGIRPYETLATYSMMTSLKKVPIPIRQLTKKISCVSFLTFLRNNII